MITIIIEADVTVSKLFPSHPREIWTVKFILHDVKQSAVL
jgi:hypothetical protein